MAAQIIGALFAMLMTAVIVGTMIQMQKDGIMSPHSIFLLFVIGRYFAFVTCQIFSNFIQNYDKLFINLF